MTTIDSSIGINLADIVERYLIGQGKVPIRSFLARGQMKYLHLVGVIDKLGKDSFVEGKIAKKHGV